MTPCLEAPASMRRDRSGYARTYPGGGREGMKQRSPLLHRIVMAEVYGWEAIRGKVVMHLCDNPPCYRLSHLRLGTPADNTHDMWAKGRARPGTTRGEDHPRHKLTDADVVAIRAALATGVPGQRLAHQYGIHHSTLYAIRDRKRWTHL